MRNTKNYSTILLLLILICVTNNLFAQKEDLGISSIQKSDAACLVSTTDTISITIQNYGTPTSLPFVTNFPVSYQRFGGNVVTEICTDTVYVADSIVYTFMQTVDLSKSWNTNIRSWTNFSGDFDPENDSFQLNIDCECLDSIGTPYVCNQVIIQYDPNISAAANAQIQTDLMSAGGHLLDSVRCGDFNLDRWSLPDLLFWNGNGYIGAESQVEGLKTSTAGIEEADLNVLGNGNALDLDKLDYQKTIAAPKYIQGLTKENSTTPPVKIVVLDTGLDLVNTPSVFLSAISCETCEGLPDSIGVGYDFINMDNDPTDDHNHGTNVTSVILDNAEASGFTNFQIIPIKVLDHQGQGSIWEIVLGTLTAKVLNADVVNASFGWLGSESEILTSIIDALGDDCHGLFVASAGNEANNNDTLSHYPSNSTLVLNNVIAVAALDSAFVLATYSNYGKYSVDVAAPGKLIDDTGMVIGQGTSYAAPYIAIKAAMAMGNNEHQTAAQIKSCIHSIKRDNYPPLIDSLGNIQVFNVLNDTTNWAFEDCVENVVIDSFCVIQSCIITNTQSFFSPKQKTLELLAFPNPFTDVVTFEFFFETTEEVHLKVFDITGRMIYQYYEPFAIYDYQLKWRESSLPSGIYLAHIQTKKGNGVVKIIKQ